MISRRDFNQAVEFFFISIARIASDGMIASDAMIASGAMIASDALIASVATIAPDLKK